MEEETRVEWSHPSDVSARDVDVRLSEERPERRLRGFPIGVTRDISGSGVGRRDTRRDNGVYRVVCTG